jgi:hypothetical protein
MTDDELRALVRDAVNRHLAGRRSPAVPVPEPSPREPLSRAWEAHPSHALYLTVVNAEEACVIEPSATCDHCGYCRSHGH